MHIKLIALFGIIVLLSGYSYKDRGGTEYVYVEDRGQWIETTPKVKDRINTGSLKLWKDEYKLKPTEKQVKEPKEDISTESINWEAL